MTLTQRITAVIQQRKIMQDHIKQGLQVQQQQYSTPQDRKQYATNNSRVTIWSGGKRINGS